MSLKKIFLFVFLLGSFNFLYAASRRVPLVLSVSEATSADLAGIYSRVNSFYSSNQRQVSEEILKDCSRMQVRYGGRDEYRGVPAYVKFLSSNRTIHSSVYLGMRKNKSGIVKSGANSTYTEEKYLNYIFRDEASKVDYLLQVNNEYRQNYWTKELVAVRTDSVFVKIDDRGEIHAIHAKSEKAFERLNNKKADLIATPIITPFIPFTKLVTIKHEIETMPLRCGNIGIKL